MAVTDSRPQPRPKFEVECPLPPDDVVEHVRAYLKEHPVLEGMFMPGRIELTILHDDHHLWSPQLTIDVEDHGDQGSTLHGRFGPSPAVWTMYVAVYAILFMLTCVSLMYGTAQWLIAESPWGFYVAPISGVLGGLVYGASFVGQGLGYPQMHALRTFLDDALREHMPQQE